MIAFVNDRFIKEENATIQIGDLSIQRGYAAFDFFRTVNNTPLFLDDHLDRFFQSAKWMLIEPQHSRDELKTIIHDLLEKNNAGTSGIKMILTGGYADDGYSIVKPNLIMSQQLIQLPGSEKFEAGVKIITQEYSRDLPAIKSTNYLMGVWLQQKLKTEKADDVLYYQNGIITELPRANIFIITADDEIVTPANHILKGVTRKKILEMTDRIEERDITVEELKTAKEVFMTSTTKRLLPVTQINGLLVGSGKAGPVTTALCKDFVKMETAWLRKC
jgi:branched-chain amino acid aminotransferase